MKLLLLAVLLPAPVLAQGLGDAANRERSRRETKPAATSAPAFTNDDLPERAEGEPVEETEAEGAEEEPAPELDRVGEADPLRAELDRAREKRARLEREWRERFAAARARLAEEEARCWQEVIRTRFHHGIPVQMRVQEFVETEGFRQARQDLADLQEEFRRTGQPPGWARE